MMPKASNLTQHVQENLESISPDEISSTQTAMSELLAGRFFEDVSQYSSPHNDAQLKPSSNVEQSIEVTSAADQRAKLFAQLGIRSEKIQTVPEDIEKLIATLSHIEARKRIEAAHTIADLYENLPAKKQMHVRINLILMTWRDKDAYARIAAIKALSRTKMPDVSEALQMALRDEEQIVRAAAARALGEIPARTAVVALVAAATRENEHWSVRAAAIHAMGVSGERIFLNTVNLALDDEDASIRIAAIYALTRLEGLQAAPRLTLIAQRDKQPHIRHAAILALENLGTSHDKRHT